MKKSYIKSKNLSKRIITAIALGIGMSSVLAGVVSAETIYRVSGHEAQEDNNDLNGSSTIGRNMVVLGEGDLLSGNSPVGNIIMGNFVGFHDRMTDLSEASVIRVLGDRFTADNVNVFTLARGQNVGYTPSSLLVSLNNSASFGNMSNTLTGNIIIPRRAIEIFGGDDNITLSTAGYEYKNANISVQAKDITTKVITVKGTSGHGPSSKFSYTATNNIETGDINTEAEGNVVLSADNNISLGSVTRTAGAAEGDGVTPGKTEVTKAKKLTIDGITIGEGSFVASHVSDTVQINKDISASSQTKAVSINIDSSQLATIKGSTAQGAKASISLTGGGVDASGVAKSIDGGNTTFESGHENISVAGAEATGTNSRVKLRSEFNKVNINGDAVSKSGGKIEASSDYDDITVTGAVKTESGGQVNINARMGKVSANSVAAKDANSTVSISGEGTEITGAVEASNGASATIDGTTSSGEVGSASATGDNSRVELRGESVTVNNTLSVKEKGAIALNATSGEATVKKDIHAKGGNINITATSAATVDSVVAETDEHNVIGTVTIDGGSGTAAAASINASGAGSKANVSGNDVAVTNGVVATDGAKATVQATSGKGEVGSASATGENSTVEISGDSVAVDNTLTAKGKGAISLSSTSDGVTVDKDIDAKGGNITITASSDATVASVVAETDEHNVIGTVTIDGGSGTATAASAKASGAGSIAKLSGRNTEVTGAIEAEKGGQTTVQATSESSEVGSVNATGENSKIDISGESTTVLGNISSDDKASTKITATSGSVAIDRNNYNVTANGGSVTITATSGVSVGGAVSATASESSAGSVSIDAGSRDVETGGASASGENSKIELKGRSAAISGNISSSDKAVTKITATNGDVDIDKYGNSTVEANGGSVIVTATSGVAVGGAVSASAHENNGGSVSLDAGDDKVQVGGSSATGENSKIELKGNSATIKGSVSSDDKASTKITATNGAVNINEDGSTVEATGGSVVVSATSGVTVAGAVSARASESNAGSVSLDAGSREVSTGGASASGENSHIELKGTSASISGNVSSSDKASTKITATNGDIDINQYGNSNVEANGGSVVLNASSGVSVGGGVSASSSGDNEGSADINGGEGEVAIGRYNASTINVKANGGTLAIAGKSGVTVNGDIISSQKDNKKGVVTVDAGTGEAKLGNASASGENSKVAITGGTATLSGGVSASDKATTNITATSGGVTVGQYGTQGVEATGGTVAITGSTGVDISGAVTSTSSDDKGGSTTIDGGTGTVTIDQYDSNNGDVSATGEDSKVEVKGASAVMGGNLTATDNAVTKINVTGEVDIGQFHKNGPSRVQANGATVQVNGGEGVTIAGKVTAATKDGTAGSTTVDGGSGTTTVAVGAANGDGSQLSITGTGVEATAFVGASGGATTSVDAKSEQATINRGSATGSSSALSISGTGVEIKNNIEVYKGATVDVDGKTGKTEITNADATDANSVMNIKGATTVVTDEVLSLDKSTINITASDKAVVGGDAEQGLVNAQAGTININGAHGAAIKGSIQSEASNDGVGEINVDGGDGKVSAVQVGATSGSKARITGIGAEVEGMAIANDGGTTIIDGKTGDVEADSAGALGENSQLEIKGDKATVDTVIRTDQGGTAKITGDKGATIGNGILSDNGGSAIVDAGTGEALVGTDDLIAARLTAAHKGSIEFVGNGATVNGGLDSEEGGTVSVDGKSGATSIYGSIITNSKDTNNKNEITVEGSTASVAGDLSVNNGQVSVKGKKVLGGSTTVVNVNVAANGTVDLGDSKTDTIIKGDVSTAEGLTADAPAELNIHGKTITYFPDKKITGNANSTINVGDKDSTESISVKEASANGENSVVNIKAKGNATIKTIKATKGGKISLDTKPANITDVEADGDGSVATVDSDGVIGDIDKAYASNNGKIVLHTTDIFTIESKDKPDLSTSKGGRITVKADKGIIAKTKITANGVDYTSKGEVNIMDVDTDPNNPNSTEISGKDVTTKDFNAKAGGSIGITGDRSINVDGDIIADGKDANIEVAHKHNELKLLAAPGKLIEAKNGGHIVLTSPDGIDITAPNVIADGADTSAQAQPGTPSTATKPGDQAAPGTAVKPGAQASPGTPSSAVKPGAQTNPGAPSAAVKPDTQAQPGTPSSVTKPDDQAKPETPSAVVKPGDQTNPGTPGTAKPGTPASPSSPSAPSATAKTSASPKTTTLIIGTVDADNHPTVTKDVKLVDLEAYHGARVSLASQAEIKVQSAKTNTEGQIRFYSTKTDGDGVTITNLSTVEAIHRPEPKPVVKTQTKTEAATAGKEDVKPVPAAVKPAGIKPAPVVPASPVAPVEKGSVNPADVPAAEDIVPAKPADPEYASIIIDSKNSHIVNLTGSTNSDKLGRILIQDAGDTLRIDKFQAGAQEFGLDIYYSPEAIKTINPAGKVDTDRLIITNGSSTPQTLAIKDIAFNKAFDTLTAAKDAAKKAGNRRFTPLIPFAAVLNPSSHENTFRVNVAPIKWNLGKELKDRLVVQRKPYNHHKFAPQFKNYFNKLSDNELIYFVALKVIPAKIFVDSALSNGEQIYNLATGNNLGVNRGYGMVKGIQAHNSVGMWTEAYTSRTGYKGLYHGTLSGLNIGYNLKSNKKATVGISVDYARNSGSLAWTSTHTTSKLLALNVYKHGTLKNNLYYSLQARLGQAKASFACNDDGEIVTGNQKANFGQISGEVDKMKQLKHGKYLSTQGELRLTRIGGKDYDASNEVTLKTDNMTSVLSRIGVVYGQERTNAKGLNSSYYMSFNIFHEFAGNVKLMTIDDIGEEYNYAVSNKGTWGSFGIGYRTQLSAKTSAFLDYGHTLGGHRSIGTLHMGAKWLF